MGDSSYIGRAAVADDYPLLRFVDAEGRVVADLPAIARDRNALIALYRAMVQTRVFDQRAIALQRTGRLGTFASTLGQEAVGVGAARAMDDADVLLPSFREHGAQLVRGVTPAELFQYWGGDERGSNFAGPREDFPVSIPIASHAPHAVGVALAMKLRGQQRAAVCILGDGATSKGDFYEAINLAGVWALPVVFLVNNNGWAISQPRSRQSRAVTLAHKAMAAGIAGMRVDGNDVVAVYEGVRDALERARTAREPTLIEAETYRLSDHTTVDDARRYRDENEVRHHWHAEPIARSRAFLTAMHDWTAADEERLLTSCHELIDQAAATYLAFDRERPQAAFDSLFAQLPEPLAAQRADLIAKDDARA